MSKATLHGFASRYFYLTCHWVLCYCIRDISMLIHFLLGRITMAPFRFWYNFSMDGLFLLAIGFKIYG